MSIQFIESFATGNPSCSQDTTSKWTVNQGWSDNGAGRHSGARAIQANFQYLLYKQFPFSSNCSTWIAGFAFNTVTGTNASYIFKFQEESTVHLYLGWIDSTNKFQVQHGANGQVLWTSANTYAGGVWHYVEFKAFIDDSVGSFSIQLNGMDAGGNSGIDTRNGGVGTINRACFAGHDGFGGHSISDVYLVRCDGVGQNTFIGDCRVDALYPIADSTVTWTRNTGSNNASAVDESPSAVQDGDSTYVTMQGAGNTDLYTMSNTAYTNGSILAVATSVVARKDDVGVKSIYSAIKTGSNTFYSNTHYMSANLGYAVFSEVWENNPTSGFAWTIDDVNGIEAGFKS